MRAEPHDFTEYELRIDFEEQSEDPARVFDAMATLVRAFEHLDEQLAASISAEIRPVVLLVDVEVGSLATRLRVVLESIDDDALKELNWRKLVGSYLVRAKKHLVHWLRERERVERPEEVDALREELRDLARETDVRWLDTYQLISLLHLLHVLLELSRALERLGERDAASFTAEGETLPLNRAFRLSDEEIEKIVVKDTVRDQSERLLQVKKPDYLGQSMWELRDDGHTVPAKILDHSWLEKFQNREVTVRPGDSLRVLVDRRIGLDENRERVYSRYDVREVRQVVPRPRWRQQRLLPDDDVDD